MRREKFFQSGAAAICFNGNSLQQGIRTMPVELGYFTIAVKDVARAEKFYGALFGWEFAMSPMGAHIKNTKLPIGFSTKGPVDISFTYFKVKDVEEASKQVAELGGKVRSASESPSGKTAECADDQGTVFSLWQPAPGFE